MMTKFEKLVLRQLNMIMTIGVVKSNRESISNKELRKLRKQSNSLLSMSDAEITAALQGRVLVEIQEEMP